jgi:hypothetical protein
MYGKGVSRALHWRITVWWRHWTSSFAPIGDISGAVAWAALHYMAPPGSSVFIGQTPFYRAPAGPHVQTKRRLRRNCRCRWWSRRVWSGRPFGLPLVAGEVRQQAQPVQHPGAPHRSVEIAGRPRGAQRLREERIRSRLIALRQRTAAEIRQQVAFMVGPVARKIASASAKDGSASLCRLSP